MLHSLITNLRMTYGWRSATVIANMLDQAGYNPLRYLIRFWSTQTFTSVKLRPLGLGGRLLADVVRLFMVAQLAAGLWLTWYGLEHQRYELEFFGLAIMVSYPLIWAHLAPLISIFGLPFKLKSVGKSILCRMLERQVRQLRARHDFAVVAVAGSVGKTSTKLAIADALNTVRRVRYQIGNYNDRLTVPLVFFGHTAPGLYNLPAWLRLVWKNRRLIKQEFPYDVVVVELGVDGIGQLRHFDYLQAELGVLTAIAPEHMEQFGSIQAVADEELVLFDLCKRVLVNTDDVDGKYLTGREYVSYGGPSATYAIKSVRPNQKLGSQHVTFDLAGRNVSAAIRFLGQHGAKVALAAAAAACEMALSREDVESALGQLKPFAGRMQILSGQNGSTLIDDTYNSSPSAIAAALDVLRDAKAKQRIAILGSMNEMGDVSQEVHEEAGKLCDPKWLDLLVTVGRDAHDYLAPIAQAAGCHVESFFDPRDAGEYVKQKLTKGSVVLVKGSQFGVYTEEALKLLLKDAKDAERLVRQSDEWMKIKRRQFRGL